MEQLDYSRKIDDLLNAGFFVGMRDINRNTAYTGRYMVCEDENFQNTEDAAEGGFCIVGDDMEALVNEAHEQFFS